ncbi:hypothetical protein FB451DRAFT_99147 [Mycena latifolia]|nr:hypothetical protein FB451DRAFT_99147 [Mycena latifolia]
MDEFGDQVVSIEAVERTKKAMEEHLQDPSKPEAEGPSPFVFSMIVFITYENFYGMPCANWNGPTIQTRTFADAKLTFTGKAPTHPHLAKDFHESWAKLAKIFDSAKTPDAHGQRGVLIPPSENASLDSKLKFTHRLFETVQEGDEDDDDVPVEFTIQQWPVRSDAAKKALAELKSTHRVIHLPAFDASPEGKVIPPGAYKTQLAGALAQIQFTLSHWSIRSKTKCGSSNTVDVFAAANLVHIRILNPPANCPPSPSKRTRKFTATDDVSGDISPKKPRLQGPSIW